MTHRGQHWCAICDCVQDLQDELEDLTEQSNELQEVMGQNYGELEAGLDDSLGTALKCDCRTCSMS